MPTRLNKTTHCFEAEQHTGACPRIEDYLPDGEERRDVLLEFDAY